MWTSVLSEPGRSRRCSRLPFAVAITILIAALDASAQPSSDYYTGYENGRVQGRIEGLVFAAVAVAVIAAAIFIWRKSRSESYLSVRKMPPEALSTASPESAPMGTQRATAPVRPTVHQDWSGATAPRGRVMFVSYRREDSADITGRISDRLIQKFGRDSVFKDVDSIPLGMDFRKHLHDAVSKCDVLLVIVGRNWCDAATPDGKRRLDDPRDHLRIEVEAALQRDIPVIPILVQGATMPNEDQLPESLRSLAYRHALAVRPDPDFNGDADRLLRGLQAHFEAAK